MKIIIVNLLLVFVGLQKLNAQDSMNVNKKIHDSTFISKIDSNKIYQFNYKKIIIPTALISYGIASLKIDGLKQLNFSTRDEINEHKPDHIKLDNYTQFAPAVLVYVLNTAGLEGKHNFRDRSLIYGTSMLITSAIIIPLKHIVREERPDQSNKLSFPSGHTAIAFASAQFMFREYKDTNFMLAISGYSFAIFTGMYRTLNDKHWVGDVVAGAGFGIVSTEIAYWLYPKISNALNARSEKGSMMAMPFYQDKKFGIGLVKSF